MELYLNGQMQTLDDGLSVADLLVRLDLHQQRVAVEVNRCIIAKSRHSHAELKDGDRVEIIQAMGGG